MMREMAVMSEECKVTGIYNYLEKSFTKLCMVIISVIVQRSLKFQTKSVKNKLLKKTPNPNSPKKKKRESY